MIKLIEIYNSVQLQEKGNLTPRTLAKDTKVKNFADRGEVLLSMINADKPVKLVSGESIVVDKEKSNEFIQKLIDKDYRSLIKIPFFDKDGQSYLLGKLEKTSDFGGQEIARGMAIEDRTLSSFMSQIEEAGGKVNIRIGGKIYKNIVSAGTPTANPKADFILRNDKGEDVIFISHKDYDKYQQYSGVASLLDYPDVSKFIKKVNKLTDGQMTPKTAYKSEIKDDELMIKAVYGKDESFGLNKVQLVVVGAMTLVKVSNTLYEIKAESNKQIVWTYPEIPPNKYKPILGVSYRKSVNQQGVKDARFGIYPTQLFNYAKMI
jgi:hypothetical protein